jgi:hypothetical protein
MANLVKGANFRWEQLQQIFEKICFNNLKAKELFVLVAQQVGNVFVAVKGHPTKTAFN